MTARWRILRGWYREHRKGAWDLLALTMACGLSFALVFLSSTGALFLSIAHQRPDWYLPELALCLALSSLFIALFAWRRWREVSALLMDAGTDALTGLYNRRKIQHFLHQEFERAMRYGKPLSVILFDVDHFKRVNDNHGHPAGDAVLAAIARRVRRRMRTTDHFGRWGGEEFMLICPETDRLGAIHLAERMRRSIKRRPVGKVGMVTASFGVVTSKGLRDVTAMIDKVDRLLYVAKEQGRDRVAYRLDKTEGGGPAHSAGDRSSEYPSTVIDSMQRARPSNRGTLQRDLTRRAS